MCHCKREFDLPTRILFALMPLYGFFNTQWLPSIGASPQLRFWMRALYFLFFALLVYKLIRHKFSREKSL